MNAHIKGVKMYLQLKIYRIYIMEFNFIGSVLLDLCSVFQPGCHFQPFNQCLYENLPVPDKGWMQQPRGASSPPILLAEWKSMRLHLQTQKTDHITIQPHPMVRGTMDTTHHNFSQESTSTATHPKHQHPSTHPFVIWQEWRPRSAG